MDIDFVKEQIEMAKKASHLSDTLVIDIKTVNWLVEQAEKVEKLQEFLRVMYNLSVTEINAGHEIRQYVESRVLEFKKIVE